MRASDQTEKQFFQTDRFFRSDGMWYFATREGVDFGPFTVKNDGEKALQRYVDTQKTMARLRRRDPTIRDGNAWDNQNVAKAAQDISGWRLERNARSDSIYSDRSEKHK